MTKNLKIFTITLDRPRQLAWDTRARIRFDSLERQPSHPGMYQLCALIWAMLSKADAADFKNPEDLAQYLDTKEAVDNASATVIDAVNANTPTKSSSEHGVFTRTA